MKKDYLLKFPSKGEAVAFGLRSGFVSMGSDGQPFTTLATHTYAVAVIGPWLKQVGEDAEGLTIVESDNNHWVLFRDLVGLSVPEGAEPYIFWTSDGGAFPKNCPQVFWS